MVFKKGHKDRWLSDVNNPLDKSPICFKGRDGQKEALKDIPDWQDKLRDFIDQLVEESKIL